MGWSTATDGKIHAFVWSSATGIVDLGTSGQTSFATAISPDGNTVIGDINVAATPGVTDQQGQLAIWMKFRVDLDDEHSHPVDYLQPVHCPRHRQQRRHRGQLLQLSAGAQPSTTQYGLLLPHTGGIVGLGDTGKVDCYVRGINDSGVIAGSDGSFATGTAWVDYNQTAGGKTSLGTLLAAGQGTGWSLMMAESIDDAGQITGIGKIGSAYDAYCSCPSLSLSRWPWCWRPWAWRGWQLAPGGSANSFDRRGSVVKTFGRGERSMVAPTYNGRMAGGGRGHTVFHHPLFRQQQTVHDSTSGAKRERFVQDG